MKIKPELDCDRADVKNILDHGSTTAEDGPIKVMEDDRNMLVSIHDTAHGLHSRGMLNGFDRRSYDEVEKTKHFPDRMQERLFTEDDARYIVDNGIVYYDGTGNWCYAAEIDGHVARVIRDGPRLVTIFWQRENPRKTKPHRATSAYRRRKGL